MPRRGTFAVTPMTGYPPDDGPFPGRPGEPPFPGRPGGHPPGHHPAPPPQPGPYGPYGQQGPRQPHAGQPFPPPAGYGPPGGPPPPAPGYPGQPGQPARRSRRGLWIGIAAVAALLLIAGTGLVVRSVADARPYASLPGCYDLLPTELMDTIPGAAGPRAEGGFTPVEEMEFSAEVEDTGLVGSLGCDVSNGHGDHLMGVYAGLYDVEDGAERVEELRDGIADAVDDLEQERFGEEQYGTDTVVDVLAWDPLSTGDGGYAVVAEFADEEWADGQAFGSAEFSAANVEVGLSFSQEGRVDEAEMLDFLDGFAGQVARQLSREGERV